MHRVKVNQDKDIAYMKPLRTINPKTVNGMCDKDKKADDEQSSIIEAKDSAILIEDSIIISIDGKNKAEEEQNRSQEMQDLMRQLENSREQAKAMGEDMKIRMKCLEIAMSIMSGDKVPLKDERYLAKHDLGLYAKALMMRVEKEKPKKLDSILEDEEDNSDSGGDGSVKATVEQMETSEIQAEAPSDPSVSVEV